MEAFVPIALISLSPLVMGAMMLWMHRSGRKER